MDTPESSQHSKDNDSNVEQSIEVAHDEQNQEHGVSVGTGNSYLDENEDSLFIPEHETAPLQTASQSGPTSNTSLPAHSSPVSHKKPPVARNRMREMQRRIIEKRTARGGAAEAAGKRNYDVYFEDAVAGPSSASTAPEVEPEEADRKAIKQYEHQKRHYDELKKKNGGWLPLKYDVEWMRIQTSEENRRKKRQRDLALAQEAQADDDFQLFPLDPEVNHGHDEDDHSGSHKRRCQEQPHKQLISMQEAELKSMQVAFSVNRDKGKKKNYPREDTDPQAAQSSDKGKGKAKAKGPNHKNVSKSGKASNKVTRSRNTGKESARKKNERELGAQQIESLLRGSNVFRQQAGAGAHDQPTFSSKIKKTALTQIIASLPLEDQKLSRGDMNMLLAATTDFDGRGACKSDGAGHWLVRGMKTSLKAYQVLGTSFMRRRENGVHEPRGGLVADQMGLGKTLMMLGKSRCLAVNISLTMRSKHCQWTACQRSTRSQDDTSCC